MLNILDLFLMLIWTGKHCFPVHELSKKILRVIECYLSYYVNKNILQHYIHPFFPYGLSVWSNTYSSALRTLIILQWRATRTITFSKPDEHTEHFFRKLEILKLSDLVILHSARPMYQYHINLLSSSFDNFFQTISSIHQNNTKIASKSTFYIKNLTFNIRFEAVRVWNNLDQSIKHLPLKIFQKKQSSTPHNHIFNTHKFSSGTKLLVAF